MIADCRSQWAAREGTDVDKNGIHVNFRRRRRQAMFVPTTPWILRSASKKRLRGNRPRRRFSPRFNNEGGSHGIQDRSSYRAEGRRRACRVAGACPRWAQDKPTLRFAAVFSDKDIRADMIQMFAKDIEADFKLEPFYGGILFKQGTELVALQRDNLEMGNIAPQDISKQVPAWSILTSAYLFRDANHLNAFFAGDLGAQMKKMAEDQLKVKILGPTFFGTRQVGLKPKKKINTPADMAGIKLRMPPGRRVATPRPLARRESDAHGVRRDIYGAADRRDRRPGQSAAERAEHEVLRGDVADRADLAPDRLRPAHREHEDLEQHAAGQAEGVPGRGRQGDRVERGRAPEARSRSSPTSFKKQGLDVYAPDVNAFRATRRRCISRRTKRRPGRRGMLEKINAMK